MTTPTFLHIQTTRFKLRALWVWRAWPFIVMALIELTRWKLVGAFPTNQASINTWISACAQIVGILVVIASLSQNLHVFGKGGFRQVFMNYLKEYPIFRDITANFSSSAGISLSGTGAISVSRGGPQTIDERVAALEQQFKTLSDDLNRKEQALGARLDQMGELVSKNAEDARTALASLAGKVKDTAVGSLMPQIFGALLASYGVLLGVLTQP